MTRATGRSLRALLASLVLVGSLAACTNADKPAAKPLPSVGPYSTRPNIVFVLTDDLSMNLVPFMPHVAALQQVGMTFTNYTVTDSLCCPSRASILTGEFPHNTGVFTNDPPDGSYTAFAANDDEKRTVAVALQRSGYRTALMGKYLNGYQVGTDAHHNPPDYVPPGWTDWAGIEHGYGEFDYDVNHDHKIVHYGNAPSDYLTRVISGYGQDFIADSVRARKPFFLEMATFAPHGPFTPDPQDANLFPDLKVPRGPSYNRLPLHGPHWLERNGRKGLSARTMANLDKNYRKRVQSVQSVDRMIGQLQDTLRRTGQLDNTIFVFNSDNGYHMGEHGMGLGKLTAFDTDIHVPLVISGPGIAQGSVNEDVVQNIDLAPTFEQLAGVPVPSTVDGTSLVPLLHGQHPPWRTLALVEHHGPVLDPSDPDMQNDTSGNPPSYYALRSKDWTYVHYVTGEREYYNRITDPYENDDAIATLPQATVAKLDRTIATLTLCRGTAECWAASDPRGA